MEGYVWLFISLVMDCLGLAIFVKGMSMTVQVLQRLCA